MKRRQRELLRRSLASPHPETSELGDADFDDWAAGIPSGDGEKLVDVRRGSKIRWVPGRGWLAGAKQA